MIFNEYVKTHKRMVLESRIRELTALAASFFAMGGTQSDSMGRKEWIQLATVYKPDISQGDANILFQLIDTNLDGSLSLVEFLELVDIMKADLLLQHTNNSR